ncbi:MAG: hypothetical protein ACI8P0_003993 [Planctomycetaceae bacterium]
MSREPDELRIVWPTQRMKWRVCQVGDLSVSTDREASLRHLSAGTPKLTDRPAGQTLMENAHLLQVRKSNAATGTTQLRPVTRNYAGSESSPVQRDAAATVRSGSSLLVSRSAAGLVEVESGVARSSSTDLWVDQA